MSLDKKIRDSLNGEGKYLIVHSNDLEEGINYAIENKVPQIQLRGVFGIKNADCNVDFGIFKKFSGQLKYLSLDTIENAINIEGLYSLENLERLYIDKQKFKIDLSRFSKLQTFGGEYWKGLLNIDKSISLQGIVIRKLPYTDLNILSKLQRLEALHVYSSKIITLKGIEKLPIKQLSLVRNASLEDINVIKDLKLLERLTIEKCKKIEDLDYIESLKEKINVRVIK